MYLLPGSIIYFTPFYFSDGKTAPKNKYFVVLCHKNDDLIVASLPSSQDYVPAYAEKEHGCIEIPEGGFNCYFFSHTKPVTTDGWHFPLPTYIYGTWIDTYHLNIFKDIYVVEGVDYEIIGRLTREEFEAIIQCFAFSSSTKRKYKEILKKVSY
jgi:hypothetical protein